ncbi:MAG: PAC2 family protein [Candidatus Bathyarchaeota archaeon]|nr:MAG: PAC2 family protein [Candidatus Bathyarchaeota archaeon]
MRNSFIRYLFRPKLDNPVFVEGLPGFGNVGKNAADLFTKYLDGKLFAEYYSPFFPDYVHVGSNGICSPPHYEFYAPLSKERLNAIVLTGDSQPQLDNVPAHYEICEEILDFAQKLDCELIVTIGGVPVSSERKDVYVAATTKKLAAEIMGKGGLIYGKGRIMGATGLLLGLAKRRGLKGFCLLGATAGLQSDKEAGVAVFNLLLDFLRSRSKNQNEWEKG